MDISLYIHIPFCVRKCYYCDFVSYPVDKSSVEKYVDALVGEMELNRGYKLKTIYMGGGTPTCIACKYLDKIFSGIYRYFSVEDCKEITVEANPGTLSRDKLVVLKELGVNRLSIGLQSWHDKELTRLGRIHRKKDFVNNYIEARKTGFENISVDLMFSIPDQTVDSWMTTLRETVSLQPEHISCYSLKIEEGTLFYDMFKEGKLEETDHETDREMYHRAVEYLGENGYERYEISNFALKDCRCIHNMTYWNNQFYLGLGVAAHSFLNNSRIWNVSGVGEYCQLVNEDQKPVEGSEHITRDTEIFETIFLKLRTSQGINFDEFRNRFGVDMRDIYEQQLYKLEQQGLIRMEKDAFHLTLYGIDVSNRVFEEFIYYNKSVDKK